ncbi:MAG: hemerythrin domain-containing protein [Pseudomonadota bacterium]
MLLSDGAKLVPANVNAAPEDGPVAMAITMLTQLTLQAELCKALEHLADVLPARLHQAQVHRLIQTLPSVLAHLHRYEEGVVHPYLIRAAPSSARGLDRTLTRLCQEHVEDRAFAEELAETLTQYMRLPNRADANRIGYMLRGFFEGLRRHIAFEREHVLPLLSGRATTGGRQR